MKKILIICGPTACGKTSLGLKLAKKFNGEIVSADSRQVYKGLSIGTGKDIPEGAVREISDIKFENNSIEYYLLNHTKVWGYDVVDPLDDFSTAQYHQLTKKIISDIYKRRKIPIIVGGSGLYINAIVDSPETLSIPPNKKLRKELEGLTVEELQEKLIMLDKHQFKQLNNSDKNNPRRLIRHLEKSTNIRNHRKTTYPTRSYESLWIGLNSDKEKIDQRINQRVRERANSNMTAEVNALNKLKLKVGSSAMTATGYNEWGQYLAGKISKDEAISKWQTREHQYARRQMTWFKKNPDILWFDITSQSYSQDIVEVVENWYANSNERQTPHH